MDTNWRVRRSNDAPIHIVCGIAQDRFSAILRIVQCQILAQALAPN
jgi:hypothetical protein